MPVPADPPVAVTPPAFRTWALDVADTVQAHDVRIAAVEAVGSAASAVLANTTFTLGAGFVQIGASLVVANPGTAVTVDVGIVGTWALMVAASAQQHSLYTRIDVSLDGGTTWSTGQEHITAVQETGATASQINWGTIANAHVVSGTPTGSIHVRVMGRQTIGATGGGRAERIVVVARLF